MSEVHVVILAAFLLGAYLGYQLAVWQLNKTLDQEIKKRLDAAGL